MPNDTHKYTGNCIFRQFLLSSHLHALGRIHVSNYLHLNMVQTFLGNKGGIFYFIFIQFYSKERKNRSSLGKIQKYIMNNTSITFTDRDILTKYYF